MRIQRLVLISGLAALIMGCSSGPDDDARYRQGVFTAMAYHFGPLGAMSNDRMPFDSDEFQRRATIVQQLSILPWEGFKQGSHGGSDASPTLWDEREKFDGLADDFMAAAETLAAASDEAAMREAFSATASTCRECHNAYRDR